MAEATSSPNWPESSASRSGSMRVLSNRVWFDIYCLRLRHHCHSTLKRQRGNSPQMTGWDLPTQWTTMSTYTRSLCVPQLESSPQRTGPRAVLGSGQGRPQESDCERGGGACEKGTWQEILRVNMLWTTANGTRSTGHFSTSDIARKLKHAVMQRLSIDFQPLNSEHCSDTYIYIYSF